MVDGSVGFPPPLVVGEPPTGAPPAGVDPPPEAGVPPLAPGEEGWVDPPVGVEVELPVDTGRAATAAGPAADPPPVGVNGSRARPLILALGGRVLSLTAGRPSAAAVGSAALS